MSALCAPSADKMAKVPGIPDQYLKKSSFYSGYLDLQNANRSAHYLFVQSINGANNNDPLTLWLNGGPGCSSLLGFIQEIGPYYLQDGVNYKVGDNLTKNEHSWNNVSNLLFFESPAGVGFSYNLDKSFQYNDDVTAKDNYNALMAFYQKFPQYKSRGLWLAGQSYAGKYIPDLAALIVYHNQYNNSNIKLKGMLIGNGIMTFKYLHQSQVQFMIHRQFVNPQTIQYWKSSCQTDPNSAGCRFFQIQFAQDTNEINPYNVYGYCYYNDSFDSNRTKKFESQTSILQKLKKQYNKKVVELGSQEKVQRLTYSSKADAQELIKINLEEQKNQKVSNQRYNGAPCAYFDGMFNYFNAHAKQYNAKFTDMKWNGPCAQNITYHIDPAGSFESYKYLLSREKNRTQIILYNGNWDVVVPYIDTVKNIKNLRLKQSYVYHPWFVGNQHAGFSQLYSGLVFVTVKGASHQVPQTKRQAALQLFVDTLGGHPEFQNLPENLKFKQE